MGDDGLQECERRWLGVRVGKVAEEIKSEANEWFRAGDVAQASQGYAALLSLLGDDDDYILSAELSQLRVTVLQNAAACDLKRGNNSAAAAHCDKALLVDPKAVKALFRRGKARRALGHLQEALSDFKEVVALDKSNTIAKQEARDVTIIIERRKRAAAPPRAAPAAKGMVFGLSKPAASRPSMSAELVQWARAGAGVRVLVLRGLPGSGKRSLANEICSELGGDGSTLVGRVAAESRGALLRSLGTGGFADAFKISASDHNIADAARTVVSQLEGSQQAWVMAVDVDEAASLRVDNENIPQQAPVQVMDSGAVGNIVCGPDAKGTYVVQLSDGSRCERSRKQLDAAWFLVPRTGNGVLVVSTPSSAGADKWAEVVGDAACVRIVDVGALSMEEVACVIDGGEDLHSALRHHPLAAQLASNLLKHSAKGHKNVEAAAVLSAVVGCSPPELLPAVFDAAIARLEAVEDKAVMVLTLTSHFAGGVPVPVTLLRPPKHALDVLCELGLLQVVKVAKGRAIEVQVHVAVQALVRNRFGRDYKASRLAIELLENYFPLAEVAVGSEDRKRGFELLPHVLSVVSGTRGSLGAAAQPGASLLLRACWFAHNVCHGDAAALVERAIKVCGADESIGEGSEVWLNLQQARAEILSRVERAPASALVVHLSLLRAFEAKYGAADTRSLNTLNNVAGAHIALDQHMEAVPILRTVVAGREAALGRDDPQTSDAVNNLGLALTALNRHVDAAPMFSRALDDRESRLGVSHPETLQSLECLASCLVKMGKPAEGTARLQALIARQEAAFGTRYHPNVARSLFQLGAVLEATGADENTAAAHFRDAVAIFEATLGSEHAYTEGARQRLKALLGQ